ATLLLVAPACLLVESRQLGQVMLGMVLGLFGPAVMTGPQGSFFPELFGTRVRFTGASLGFQLGAALVGGLAPVVASTLVLLTHDLTPVALLMCVMALVSIACVRAAAVVPLTESNDGEG